MNVKTLPNNYKLFSKVEKSMTKATKIKTNLYGVIKSIFIYINEFIF